MASSSANSSFTFQEKSRRRDSSSASKIQKGIGGCPHLTSFPEGLVVRFRECGRTKVWSGLPTLSRGQASRSTTERRTCRKATATSWPSAQKLKSLHRNQLQIPRQARANQSS